MADQFLILISSTGVLCTLAIIFSELLKLNVQNVCTCVEQCTGYVVIPQCYFLVPLNFVILHYRQVKIV